MHYGVVSYWEFFCNLYESGRVIEQLLFEISCLIFSFFTSKLGVGCSMFDVHLNFSLCKAV
jgi:hypothetical protein